MRNILHLSLLILVTFFAGCAIVTNEEEPDEKPVEKIFQEAQSALKSKSSVQVKEGIGLLEEVERLYPYSPYAKQAIITAAATYHAQKEFENARQSAKRYLEFYPADKEAAYAQYIIALSYYDEIEDIGRDQGLTLDALQALRVLTEKYPNSEYARSASLKFDLTFDHLAGKEMDVGRYYLKKRHYSSAINRFRVVIEDFQTTSHTPEALHRLVECYLALGLYAEAQTSAAILGHNFQSSAFYSQSYNLLKKKGLTPKAKNNNWLSRFFRMIVKDG